MPVSDETRHRCVGLASAKKLHFVCVGSLPLVVLLVVASPTLPILVRYALKYLAQTSLLYSSMGWVMVISSRRLLTVRPFILAMSRISMLLA